MSDGTSRELPKDFPTSEAELLARLGEMSEISADAEAILGSFVKAMFPSDEPELRTTTWSEADAHAARAESAVQDPEARLKSLEKRFKTLVEQIPAVTFLAVLGEGKNEIYISPYIEKVLGFSQQEWLESPFLWFWQLHPDDREMWNQEFTRGCQTGGPFRAECRFYTRSGDIKWLHGEATLVKDELGRPSLLQGVAFDITESKRAQDVLVNQAMRKAKVEEELAIAHKVQTSILPKTMTAEGLDISAVMVPATEVGGDYYDVMPFSKGAWIAIGDVSGHGLDSGLIMLMVQSAMSALTRAQPDATPRDLLLSLNGVLYDNIRSRLSHDDHVTFSLFRYRADGKVVFAGAHEDILIFRAATNEVERIRTKGTWLGGKRDIASVTVNSSFELNPGDVMVLYTDGITEAMNGEGEQYELDRLCTAILEVSGKPAAQIRDHLLSGVRTFTEGKPQDDDQTLLVLRYGEVPAAVPTTPQVLVESAGPAFRQFATSSRFDGGADRKKLEALSVEGAPGRLSASGFQSGDVLGLSLSGTAGTPDRYVLGKLLENLLAVGLAEKAREVELDFRKLKFMSSTCFKEIVTHLSRLQGLGRDKGYRLRFITEPSLRWQKASLNALFGFAPDIIQTES